MTDVTALEGDIGKELRAGMNGILSARMREAGMPFRLIFGVELPRLRGIADGFPRDPRLAARLWSRSCREARLLAIMLMPSDALTRETANAWVRSMLTAEEAQVAAQLLLSRTPFGAQASLEWLEGDGGLPAVLACLCLRHILVRGGVLGDGERRLIEERTAELLPAADLHLRKAILALTDALPTVHSSQFIVHDS